MKRINSRLGLEVSNLYGLLAIIKNGSEEEVREIVGRIRRTGSVGMTAEAIRDSSLLLNFGQHSPTTSHFSETEDDRPRADAYTTPPKGWQ